MAMILFFYIGPALKNYRCVKAYISKSHSERVTDTTTLIPNVIPIPEYLLDDHIKVKIDQLLQSLISTKHPVDSFL